MIRESREESIARHALSLLAMHARNDTLERLRHAIEREITASLKAISRAEKSSNDEYADAIAEDECLAIEELLGLALVAAQFFLTLIRTELISVEKSLSYYFKSRLSFGGHNGYDAFKLGPMTARAKCSVVEAINAVANYWKHSEEWQIVEQKSGGKLRTVWDLSALKGNQKRTAEIVTALGLTYGSSGNLRKAAEALGVKSYEDLSQIRQTLSDWTAELLRKARIEFGVRP